MFPLMYIVTFIFGHGLFFMLSTTGPNGTNESYIFIFWKLYKVPLMFSFMGVAHIPTNVWPMACHKFQHTSGIPGYQQKQPFNKYPDPPLSLVLSFSCWHKASLNGQFTRRHHMRRFWGIASTHEASLGDDPLRFTLFSCRRFSLLFFHV